MKLTQQQNDAVNASGRVLVSAAAGSGKTAVLVERAIRRIIDEQNGMDADRMLIVTFTKAAAAEMKERITRRLAQEIAQNPFSSHLKRQQLKLGAAQFTTIDSFCINLARDNFYALDISPDFKIADSGVIAQINDSAMTALLNEKYAAEQEDFMLLNRLLVVGDNVSTLREAVLTVYRHLVSIPDEQSFAERAVSLYNDFSCTDSEWVRRLVRHYLTISEDFYKQLDELATELNRCEEKKLLEKAEDTVFCAQRVMEKLVPSLKANDFDGIYQALRIADSLPSILIKKTENPALLQEMKNIIKPLNSHFGELKQVFCADSATITQNITANTPAVRCLIDMAFDFMQRTDKAKREKNCYDFYDIERFVLKLLTEHTDEGLVPSECARGISAAFDEVLIDEYQDTNDLQNTIFTAVSDGGKKLFTVGDVKQCVYKFRQANPKIFLECRETLPLYDRENPQDASKVIMSGNFRSSDEVCDFINFTFARLFSKETAGMEYTDEDKLICCAEFQPINTPRVSFELVSCTEAVVTTADENDTTEKNGEHPEESDERGIYELEAARVAQIILETVQNGEKIITDNGELRAARFSDFAVLMRNRTHMTEFSKVLRVAGIPVRADDAQSLGSCDEIRLLMNLLRVIDNPLRDIPLLSVMLSEAGGFNAEQTARLKAASGRRGLFGALNVAAAGGDIKATDFLNKLKYLRSAAVSQSVSELIVTVLDYTGLLNLQRLYEDGPQRVANLRLLVDTARTFEGGGRHGLYPFLRYAERALGEGGIGQAQLSRAGEGCVQLMTIHRSKGLQFPICIIAATNPQHSADRTPSLYISNDGGIAYKCFDGKTGSIYQNVAFSALKNESDLEQLAEELRILYVAATRAQDMLIFTAGCNDCAKFVEQTESAVSDGISPAFVLGNPTTAALIYPCAILYRRKDKAITINTTYRNQLGIVTADERDEQQDEPLPDEQAIAQLTERLCFKYEYDELYRVSAKQTASALAEKESGEFYACTAVPMFLQNKRLTAAEKGTALHAFLQLADLVAAEHDLEGEITRLESAEILSKEQCRSLNRDAIGKFLCSSLYNRMKNAENIYREYRFMVELSPCLLDETLDKRFDNELVVIQGAIDCIFFENSSAVIVDYKTDRATDEQELVTNYSKQLQIYRLAAERIFGTPVSQSILYSLGLNREIQVHKVQ